MIKSSREGEGRQAFHTVDRRLGQSYWILEPTEDADDIRPAMEIFGRGLYLKVEVFGLI